MAASGVNLDALIPRADLAVGEGVQSGVQGEEKLGITHFEQRSFFLRALRKPEFQRETMQWAPAKIVDLVSSFLDRRLIPAVILWRAGEANFVVDGAHRISALLAWIHDDYGDGELSKALFGRVIPPEQQALADKTRAQMNKAVGPYELYRAGLEFPKAVTDRQRAYIANLSVSHFIAQWVPAASKEAAEDSFFKINDAATPLEPTEKRILQSRDSASAIASRAITHGGQGYEYWRAFDAETRAAIVETSERIYTLLYKPPLADGRIDTLDVPVAGRGYSVLPFIFDLVNSLNETKVADSTKKSGAKTKLPPDPDGNATLAFLKRVLRSVSRITGKDATSLGLHPVVYFYTRGGAFSPWAFLAWTAIVDDLFERKKVEDFVRVRKDLEAFLIGDKWSMTEIIHKNGSGSRSTPWLERYWRFVIDQFTAGKTGDEVRQEVNRSKEFGFLQYKAPVIRMPAEKAKGKVSGSSVTAAIWDAALPGAPRCHICGGLWHRNSFHTDHKTPRSEGGDNRPDNLGLAHPYCDATKEREKQRAMSAPGG